MIEGFLHIVNNNSTFAIFSFLSTLLFVIMVVSCVIIFFQHFFSLWPVLRNLAKGLVQKKIAIFSDPKSEKINNMLTGSTLIKKKNIKDFVYTELDDIPYYHILIVKWKADHKEDILKIIGKKERYQALIVYAPKCDGLIDDETMIKIEENRHCSVCNFRGRLFNDVFLSMLAIAFEKKSDFPT